MTNLLIEILFWVILLTYLGNRFTKTYKAIKEKDELEITKRKQI